MPLARRAYQRCFNHKIRTGKLLLLGLLGSLLVIFIEGWVYQNLEVKQVNAAFGPSPVYWLTLLE
jgi:hypothetical protein